MKQIPFREEINKLYREKLFRPTGVSIVYFQQKNVPLYLITQSPHDSFSWNFPQGGIDLDENLSACSERELFEELGIIPSHLHPKLFGFSKEKIDFEYQSFKRDGFIKGKFYFFSLLEYSGDFNLVYNLDEVSNYKWKNFRESIRFLGEGDHKKGDLSLRMLNFIHPYVRVLRLSLPPSFSSPHRRSDF